MKLELTEQTAVLLAFTPRTEHHGPDLESRATLKFGADLTNDFLLEVDPRLKHMLYEKADDAQEDLLEDAPLTKLRIPALSPNYPMKSDWKGVGYTLQMIVGVTGKADIHLDLCNIDKIRYTPKDGGTVSVTFNVACNPSEKDIGTIYGLMGKEVTLTLTPPSAEKLAEMNKAKNNTEPLFKEPAANTAPTDEEQLAQAEAGLGSDDTDDDELEAA